MELANKGLFDNCKNNVCSQCDPEIKAACCEDAMQAYNGVDAR